MNTVNYLSEHMQEFLLAHYLKVKLLGQRLG